MAEPRDQRCDRDDYDHRRIGWAVFVSAMAGAGRPPETVFPIAVGALVGGVLYAIPRTAHIGAIMITGFSEGELAVQLGVTLSLIWPEIVNIAIAIAAWTGLCLRDQRLRDLMIGRP